MAEPGSDLVRDTMDRAEGWFTCRVGFVETVRAVTLVGGSAPRRSAEREWGAFGVVEVDQALAERAVALAIDHDLRTLDSLHLAAAQLLPSEELHFATWDSRLHRAAVAEGLEALPEALSS